MPNYNPCIRGQAYRFFVSLVPQSSSATFQSNPTLATGDVKVSKDGGSLQNVTTLPSVAPSSSKLVQVDLSALEMDADNVTVIFSDASGAEWCDQAFCIQPCSLGVTGSVNDASATTTSFVTTLTGYGDGFFTGSFILFTDGTLQGQSRKISNYTSSSGTITLATATTSAAANSTPFIILGRSE